MELNLIPVKRSEKGITIEILPILEITGTGKGLFIAKVVDKKTGEKDEFQLSEVYIGRKIKIAEYPTVPYLKEDISLWNLFEIDGITENFFFKKVEIPYTEISLLDHFIGLERFIGFLWQKKKKRIRKIKRLLMNTKKKRFRVDYFTYPDKPSKGAGTEFFEDTNDFLSVNYPHIEGILGNLFERKNYIREVQAYIFERLLLRIFKELGLV